MTNDPKTYVDVLEELVFVTESLCDDIADIVPFYGKCVLFQDAVDLHQQVQRLILASKVSGVRFDEWARSKYDVEHVPF